MSPIFRTAGRPIIGDDGQLEILCDHGIGHGRHVHTCDSVNHGGKCPAHVIAPVPRTRAPLGTSDVGEHMCRDSNGNPDFRKERETLERELKRLRIRK